MKTVYIPTGTEVSHMDLATGHLVIDGSLTITGTLKAKTIGGRGFVEAGIVSADGIRVDDLKAVSVACRRLYAKRVEVSQIFASEGIDVSCFLGADRVVTPRLAVALSDIDEVTVDETVHLPPKKRGLLRFWLASALRSLWVKFTATDEDDVVDAEYEVKEPAPVVHLSAEKKNNPAA